MKPIERVVLADANTPMNRLLEKLGHGLQRELPCQLRCPVHKLGQESKPSARVYEDNSFVWCFTCGKQYRPTEVAEANWGCTRVEAADKLLVEWPVDPDRAKSILRAYTMPKIPTLPESYDQILERGLIQFRNKVPFYDYRLWAKKVDEFKKTLPSIPKEEQERTLILFIGTLRESLTPLRGV